MTSRFDFNSSSPLLTWQDFCNQNSRWWNNSNQQTPHPLSHHSLEEIKKSDDLTDDEFSILRALNTSSHCITTDSQTPLFSLSLSERFFAHIRETIENIDPTDQIEGSLERFALTLYEHNKTQQFLQIPPSHFVWKQKGYLCLLTDQPHLFHLCQDPNFDIFVSTLNFPVPDTIRKTINVTQIYPLEHAEDPDFCLNFTNIHAFDDTRDRSFENHFPEIQGLPYGPTKDVRSVVIVHRNSPKSPYDAIQLRERWFSFLKHLSTVLSPPKTCQQFCKRHKQLKALDTQRRNNKRRTQSPTTKRLISLFDAKPKNYCGHCKKLISHLFLCALCGKTKCHSCSYTSFHSRSNALFAKIQICKDCYVQMFK